VGGGAGTANRRLAVGVEIERNSTKQIELNGMADSTGDGRIER